MYMYNKISEFPVVMISVYVAHSGFIGPVVIHISLVNINVEQILCSETYKINELPYM